MLDRSMALQRQSHPVGEEAKSMSESLPGVIKASTAVRGGLSFGRQLPCRERLTRVLVSLLRLLLSEHE